MYDGIVNIYKPSGMTSFDVVSIMRKLTGVRKIGHTGTLDPEAKGVLVVCAGEALKCVEYMMDKDKEYVAEITFGTATDTQDSAGRVIESSDKRVSAGFLKNIIGSFCGKQLQTPPMYSALKINGKKYCDIARKGLDIDVSPDAREIEIYSLELSGIILNKVNLVEKAELSVHCSKGTYIRTLCNDIGIKAGIPAHMSALLRTKAGEFRIQDSYTIEQLREMKEKNILEKAFENKDRAYENCKFYQFDHDNIKRITNGIPIKLYLINKKFDYEPGEYVRIYDQNGRFRAVGRIEYDDNGKILKGYRIFNS